MFNVGAKVKCIQGAGSALTAGTMYTVRSYNTEYVYLNDVHGGWYHTRFVLVDDGRTSRTTDPVTSKGKRKVNKYEQAILSLLSCEPHGPSNAGLTGKEIALYTGHPLNCITPRFAPLRRKGLIAPLYSEGYGHPVVKRDKQIVWVLA